MNRKEEQTVKQEALRYSKDVCITPAGENGVKVEIPYMNLEQRPIYFFVVKRKDSKRFSLLLPVASAGIHPVNSTLALLQPFLRSYGLLLSQEAVIMEESHHSLHFRIKTFAQALLGIDGIRRLWDEESKRINAESKTAESTGDSANDRPSR